MFQTCARNGWQSSVAISLDSEEKADEDACGQCALFAFRRENHRIRLVLGSAGDVESPSDVPGHENPVSLSVSGTRAHLGNAV